MESFALLLKTFWSPGEAMFKASKNPKAIIVPLIFLGASAMFFGYQSATRIDTVQVAVKAAQKFGAELPPEVRQQMEAQRNSPAAKAQSIVQGLIGPPIMIGLLTLLFFGIFTLVGRDGGFMAFFSVTTFALIPSIFRNIAGGLMLIYIPQNSLAIDELGGISPAILLDRASTSKRLFALVNSMDLISFWILALMVIGYRFTTTKSVSTTTRVLCVLAPWLLWVGFMVAIAPFNPLGG
jgi:hypothetical protein